jgi:hypothetical protein
MDIEFGYCEVFWNDLEEKYEVRSGNGCGTLYLEESDTDILGKYEDGMCVDIGEFSDFDIDMDSKSVEFLTEEELEAEDMAEGFWIIHSDFC